MTTATEPAKPTGAKTVRLSAGLPKESRRGLDPDDLVKFPTATRHAIVTYDVARIIDDIDTGNDTAVIRILSIETLYQDAALQAASLMADASSDRTGMTTLEFEDPDE